MIAARALLLSLFVVMVSSARRLSGGFNEHAKLTARRALSSLTECAPS